MSSKYSIEFEYTKNHVSIFKNDNYAVTIYKNGECLSELKVPKIDLLDCYEKINSIYEFNEDLVLSIVTKNNVGTSSPEMLFFSLYNPKNGTKIEYKEICNDSTLNIEEDLFLKLNDTNVDIESILYLTKKNIDVFNRSSDFYTDICSHFDFPINKDIALKDRVALYYPNITLCENGCQIKGVNITSLKAICECKINNFINKNLFGNNLLYQSSFGEVEDLISKTNIEVVKCYKDILDVNYIFSNLGSYIIFFLLLTHIILSIIYFHKGFFFLAKYLLDKTEKYVSYLNSQKDNAKNPIYNNSKNFLDNKTSKNNPMKRKEKKNKTHSNKGHVNIRKKKKNKTHGNKNIKSPDIINIISHNTFKNVNSSDNSHRKSTRGFLLNSNENLYKVDHQLKLIEKSKFGIFNNPKNENDLKMEEYILTDLDDLDYDDAIKRDKRKMCEYFSTKLQTQQIIFNTFIYIEPLKPRLIKIMLFILDIDLYFCVNALFFNEEYVSEVFHLKEKDNFFSFVPRSINRFFYTTLVGVIVGFVTELFFIEERRIKRIFKREKDNIIILKYEVTEIIKDIKRRNRNFIFISLFIIIFSLYYIFCFNNVYPHMRAEWVKSSILIILVMQILSLLVCLLETIIRFISFKCKSEKIYKIGLLLS